MQFLPFRLFGNEESLKKAKENVEKHWSVVIIAEQWQKSLFVLERMVPKFFKGINQMAEGSIILLPNIISFQVEFYYRDT